MILSTAMWCCSASAGPAQPAGSTGMNAAPKRFDAGPQTA
jgi:hypothetical protein